MVGKLHSSVSSVSSKEGMNNSKSSDDDKSDLNNSSAQDPSSVPQICISLEQLDKDVASVTTISGNDSTKPKKSRRRPDVAIYRPNPGRRSLGRASESPNSQGSHESSPQQPTDTNQDVDASKSRDGTGGRKKRAEQLRYVPKRLSSGTAQSAASHNSSSTDTDLTVEVEPQSRLNEKYSASEAGSDVESIPDGLELSKSRVTARKTKNQVAKDMHNTSGTHLQNLNREESNAANDRSQTDVIRNTIIIERSRSAKGTLSMDNKAELLRLIEKENNLQHSNEQLELAQPGTDPPSRDPGKSTSSNRIRNQSQIASSDEPDPERSPRKSNHKNNSRNAAVDQQRPHREINKPVGSTASTSNNKTYSKSVGKSEKSQNSITNSAHAEKVNTKVSKSEISSNSRKTTDKTSRKKTVSFSDSEGSTLHANSKIDVDDLQKNIEALSVDTDLARNARSDEYETTRPQSHRHVEVTERCKGEGQPLYSSADSRASSRGQKPTSGEGRGSASRRVREEPSSGGRGRVVESGGGSGEGRALDSTSSRRIVSDSRLYDPYSETGPKKTENTPVLPAEGSSAGLLTLRPVENEQACSWVGDGRELYDPPQPLRSNDCSIARLRAGGDGDYYATNVPQPPVDFMYPSLGGVGPVHPYPPTVYSSPMLGLQSIYTAPNASPYSYDRSTYLPHNEYSAESYSARPDSTKQHKLCILLRDVTPLERQLSTLVSSRNRVSTENLEHINRLRETVREKLEQVLLLDLWYSTQNNTDLCLWKSVYHQLVENLRIGLQEIEDKESADDIRQQINAILDGADTSYSAFLVRLEREYEFNLSHFTSPQQRQQTTRSVKLALIMSQRILICLGDVARYRTQNNGKGRAAGDYGRARRYYLQAANVASKNGKPYNQLAIIALYAKRRLDTVFYFMRSITASNAFLSAKESLRAIYSDIYKKYCQIRQEAEERKYRSANQRKESQKSITSHQRIEHWISPIDGSRVTDRIDDDNDFDNPRKMPCNELYRRLMTTFLSCQGMIFSKVGMEHFPEASSQVLHQLEVLLSHSPLPLLDLTKFIQMFAICMFSIQHSGSQAGLVVADALAKEKCRSYTQEQAVLLCLDMVTVIIRRCIALLNPSKLTKLATISQLATSSDLCLLIPVVKLVTDWMTCHPQLWNPPPCPRDPLLGPVLDPWLSIANLANTLSALDGMSAVTFYTADDVDAFSSTNSPDHYVWLKFPEELDLRGFLPLMNLANDEVFIASNQRIGEAEAAMCYRVRKLVTFADYLCGIEPPMLDYDTQTSKYVSLVEPPSMSEKRSEPTLPHTPTVAVSTSTCQYDDDTDTSAAASDMDSSEDEGVSGVRGSTSSNVKELRRTKKRLSHQLAQQQKQQRLHQAVLDNESHGIIRLEIRPIFVVPDTNCFIEYLHYMKALVTSLRFTVVIPLVVINELDGLSRGCLGSLNGRQSDSEHAVVVSREAIKAVEFLEAQFESRNKRLKALTVTGTELHTISYRSEDVGGVNSAGTNDDRILSCCLHYCKDNARDFMPKDKNSTVTLYREVVLVTDDRNLRLKAHTRNVPVKDLVQFMEWAGMPGTT